MLKNVYLRMQLGADSAAKLSLGPSVSAEKAATTSATNSPRAVSGAKTAVGTTARASIATASEGVLMLLNECCF
jgi:hypothetical protein